jgi:hypothetical protein
LKASAKINNYQKFVESLHTNLTNFRMGMPENWRETALRLVDGVASEELRNCVNIEERRKYGAFFTDSVLAGKVLRKLDPVFGAGSVVYDPACGAGNLLLAVHAFLKETGSPFLRTCTWLGSDIHSSFVNAARIRFSIAGLLATNDPEPADYQIEDHIKLDQVNGLAVNEYYAAATHIVVNPPFNMVDSKSKSDLYSGKVSAAAIFIEKIIQHVRPGTTVLAILPDVLRSGTRYEKWRDMVMRNCNYENEVLLGQFDQYADVDVFGVKLIKKNVAVARPVAPINNQPFRSIGDLCTVCVGRVVDYRDADAGRRRGYIVSKGLPGWSTLKKTERTRQHEGEAFTPPFVAVKRTSRPGDPYRAVATIIRTPSPVYVDNHLIVLIPKSGTLKDCRKLLQALKRKETSDWIDRQIRCRHLTVKVVSNIPL